jgi:hypothetical protein
VPNYVLGYGDNVAGQNPLIKQQAAVDKWLNDPNNAPLGNSLMVTADLAKGVGDKTVVPFYNKVVNPAWKNVIYPTMLSTPIIAQGLVQTGHVTSGSFTIPQTDEEAKKLSPIEYAIERRSNWIPTPVNADGTPTKGGEVKYNAVKVPFAPDDWFAATYQVTRNETPYPEVFKGNKLSIPGAGGAPSWLDVDGGRLYYLAHDLAVNHSTVAGWTVGSQNNHLNSMAINMEQRAATPYFDLQLGKGRRPIDFNVGTNYGGQVGMLTFEATSGPAKISTGKVVAAPWLKLGAGTSGLTTGLNPLGAPAYFSFTSNPAFGDKGQHPSVRGLSPSEIGNAYGLE